jgi:hypothetical protein
LGGGVVFFFNNFTYTVIIINQLSL